MIVMRSGAIATQGDVSTLRELEGVQIEVELRIASEIFVSKMKEHGAEVTRQFGSQYHFTMPVGSSDPGRSLFQAARESGAEVRGFRNALRSLEDIYVEVTQ